MNPKTLKIDPELHRIMKTCVSRQAKWTIQEYVETCILEALKNDYGEGTINKMLNEQDDPNDSADLLSLNPKNH